jgi:hypothetical protein
LEAGSNSLRNYLGMRKILLDVVPVKSEILYVVLYWQINGLGGHSLRFPQDFEFSLSSPWFDCPQTPPGSVVFDHRNRLGIEFNIEVFEDFATRKPPSAVGVFDQVVADAASMFSPEDVNKSDLLRQLDCRDKKSSAIGLPLRWHR